MKKVLSMILLFLLLMVSVCFGADATVAAPAAPSIVDWFKANITPILAVALAISELLGSIPALKGNGILDTISKFLKFMVDRQQEKTQ